MKLAFICPEMLPLPAIKGGGIEALIDGVTPLLAKRHELTIISIKDPALPVKEVYQGAEYVRFPRQYYRSSVIKYLEKKSPPFDVIHVFNRPANVFRYKQASPTSRFVVSLHNEMFGTRVLSDEEGKRCVASCDRIITVSDYIGRTVTRRFPQAQDKVKTIYSGVDLLRYKPVWEAREEREELRSEMGLQGKKIILFVGRLKRKKGPHVLIEAFRKILPKHPDAVLVIAGSRWFSDNTVDEYVQRLHELSKPVGEKIIFTNYVPQKDMPRYYAMADVFVCPSQWQEPLARVHYEAMAAGLPIITTNRGGNAEVVTPMYNGLVINEYKNPTAFAKALDLILSRPQLAGRMGKQGRRLAEERFSFLRAADELEQVYKGNTGESGEALHQQKGRE